MHAMVASTNRIESRETTPKPLRHSKTRIANSISTMTTHSIPYLVQFFTQHSPRAFLPNNSAPLAIRATERGRRLRSSERQNFGNHVLRTVVLQKGKQGIKGEVWSGCVVAIASRGGQQGTQRRTRLFELPRRDALPQNWRARAVAHRPNGGLAATRRSRQHCERMQQW